MDKLPTSTRTDDARHHLMLTVVITLEIWYDLQICLWYDLNMHRDVEPGLLRTFRYFTFVALCYYVIVVLFVLAQTKQGIFSVQLQWYLNLITNLVLFLYLSFPKIQHTIGRFYLPIAFALSAGVPLATNLVLSVPNMNALPWDVNPIWLTFPNLLVTGVLIAWQYTFRAVIIFAICAAIFNVVMVYPLVGKINSLTLPLLGQPLLQAFSVGLVGQIVSRMVSTQHAHQRELLRANVRLSQHASTLEQLTLSRERNRLARELHDTMAHTLSGQAVNLEAIKLSLSPEQTDITEMVDQALTITRDGLSEVRRAIKDLRVQSLEDLGLSLAVRNLAMESAARADFVIQIEIDEPIPTLDAEVEHTIYRIAQEALANIVNHAQAKQVSLHLGAENGILTLTISDDGSGMDLNGIDEKSQHGLVGIRERANMLNANLQVTSQPGNGTRINFTMRMPND